MSVITPGNAPIIRTKTAEIVLGEGKNSVSTAKETVEKILTEGTPAKKPFVRKPHLTDRPFKNNDELQALRDRLASEQKPKRSNYRRPQRKTA